MTEIDYDRVAFLHCPALPGCRPEDMTPGDEAACERFRSRRIPLGRAPLPGQTRMVAS